MTTMTTIAMDAEIAYRQDKVRRDYRHTAHGQHDDRTAPPIRLGRRHHRRADVRTAADVS